jgi:hypothetical protein
MEGDTRPGAEHESAPPDTIEAFSGEKEATGFVTRLSQKVINESW